MLVYTWYLFSKKARIVPAADQTWRQRKEERREGTEENKCTWILVVNYT